MAPVIPHIRSLGEPESDVELVQRIQLNEPEAFAELYRRYRLGIYQYCFWLLQDHYSAEDATQETFIKAFKAIKNLREAARFKAWIFTITRNEVFAHLRCTKSNGLEEERVAEEQGSPYEELVNQEQKELVQRFLGELKPEYREALILLEYEQLSYAEIASITGSSLSAIESRIFKARKSLSKKLKPYFTERNKS
ncbi:MAG: RNA polymerase sigma factor [Bacteroidota bacterium]|nr:RNA polymerase sigma factor [Bacteroidota bacterium]